MTAAAVVRRMPTRPASARPHYELHARGERALGMELTIWELPSPATPRLAAPECVATLHGHALDLIEARLTRRLKESDIRIGHVPKGEERRFQLEEDDALVLALLFRALAPMRSLDRIRQVAEGIERLSREEAAYWLGMAIHRQHPRRVLAALRLLLTST